jgi:preprotein translocase subunit SecF
MSVFAALAILIYITFRFEFISGVCAVLTLVHDVLILCGIYSILRIPIDTNFIAAVLTILGYSINSTIVIFDRVRENTRHAKKQTYTEIANASVNQTLTRSINTTITTLITIGMVYILGVASIKVFAMPIIIGIFIGLYSSICISSSIWSTWKDSAVKAKAQKK